jgi:hypothetical protein
MIRAALPLVCSFLVASTLSRAQSNCPQGFNFAGTLSGTGSATTELDSRMTLRLPEDATLDESFQQKKVRVTNGKSGAHSSMTAQDVPRGLLIITYGKSDPLYEQGWAVSDPELKALARDASGKVTQYEFGMKLFCTVRKGPNPMVGECAVGVDVCYRPSH